MRKRGRVYAGDRDHVVKFPDEIFAKLGAQAADRGMSRPLLARHLLAFMLDNPEIIDELLAEDIAEGVPQ